MSTADESVRDAQLELKLYRQGAEARIFSTQLMGRPALVKRRFVKHYRHPDLDRNLSQARIKSEVRAIQRCRQLGLHTPALLHVDLERREIFMEDVQPSLLVKNYIDWLLARGQEHDSVEALGRLANVIGVNIACLHANDLIHGDLTTSNLLLKADSPEVLLHSTIDLDLVLIDFGLSYQQRLAEDKAVDLYVLERAMLSTHPNTELFFAEILTAYKKTYKKGSAEVMSKLDAVRLRGRKRVMIG